MEHVIERKIKSLFRKLRSISIDDNGSWFEINKIDEYLKMMYVCSSVAKLIESREIENSLIEISSASKALSTSFVDSNLTPYERDSRGRELRTRKKIINRTIKQLFILGDMLYELVVCRIKRMIESIPDEEDIYFSCPLMGVYAALSVINKFKRSVLKEFTSPLYHKIQCDIEYCRLHVLVISTSPVSRFNCMELQQALARLSVRWRFLPYTSELVDYVNALEDRVCDLVTSAHDDQTHNVESDRREVILENSTSESGERKQNEKEKGEKKPRSKRKKLYVSSSRLEFKLAVSIASLREELFSAHPNLRVPWQESVYDPFIRRQIMKDAQVMRLNLIENVKKLHSDNIPDSFRKHYRATGISPPEAYMYLKENSSEVVNPFVVFSQQRKETLWKEYAERSSKPLELWFERFDDPMGVRILLFLMMSVLTQQCCSVDWYDFYCPYTVLLPSSDPSHFCSMLVRSHNIPLVVQSFNDACLLWKGKLHVVGSSCNDYMIVVALWLRTVQSAAGDRLDGAITCKPLRKLLLSRRTIGEHYMRELDRFDFEEYGKVFSSSPTVREKETSGHLPVEKLVVKKLREMMGYIRKNDGQYTSRMEQRERERSEDIWGKKLLGVSCEMEARRLEKILCRFEDKKFSGQDSQSVCDSIARELVLEKSNTGYVAGEQAASSSSSSSGGNGQLDFLNTNIDDFVSETGSSASSSSSLRSNRSRNKPVDVGKAEDWASLLKIVQRNERSPSDINTGKQNQLKQRQQQTHINTPRKSQKRKMRWKESNAKQSKQIHSQMHVRKKKSK